MIETLISHSPIEYENAVAIMEQRVADIIAQKKPSLAWVLEHPDIYTAGTSSKKEDLLSDNKFPIHKTGRGGQYTYHGPDMLISYLMMDLKKQSFGCDIKKYIYNLEQCIINCLQHFGIKGERRVDRIGIWVKVGSTEKKIAAIGVRVRKWVTFHGISLNINPNLENFNGIVPCGIKEYGVTSIYELGKTPSKKEVIEVLTNEFSKIFN
jgi:lipoyl(octanoyl) transferase